MKAEREVGVEVEVAREVPAAREAPAPPDTCRPLAEGFRQEFRRRVLGFAGGRGLKTEALAV